MKKAIIIIIGLIFARFGYLYSKHFVGENELWIEKVSIKEGGFIEVYHSCSCKRSKPFFIENEDKIDFSKTKYSVYDICISDEEVKMLNAISKKNINEIIEKGWTYSEEIEDFTRYEKEICDLSNRDYEVFYCRDGLSVKKMSKPVSAWALLDDMGRKFEW